MPINDATTITLEFRPSQVKQIQFLLEDEVKIGSTYSGWSLESYADKLVTLGREGRQRSIEATEERRKAEQAAKAVAAGMERFAQELLRNPGNYQQLEQMLRLGAECHVPANVVLEYYTNRNKAQAAAAQQAQAKSA